MKYRLIDYFDVWNSEDGYIVNNLCEEGILELGEEFTNEQLFVKLKSIGYIKKSARLDMLHIFGDYDFIEIEQKCDGYPIGRLESLKYYIERHGDEGTEPYHIEARGISRVKVYD